MADRGSTLDHRLVRAIVELSFNDPRTRVQQKSLALIGEYLRIYVVEVIHRCATEHAVSSSDEAPRNAALATDTSGRRNSASGSHIVSGTSNDNDCNTRRRSPSLLSLDQLERILPQLLLDF